MDDERLYSDSTRPNSWQQMEAGLTGVSYDGYGKINEIEGGRLRNCLTAASTR